MKEQRIALIDFERKNSLVSFIVNKITFEEEVDDVSSDISAPSLQIVIDDLDNAHMSTNTIQFSTKKDLEKMRDFFQEAINRFI